MLVWGRDGFCSYCFNKTPWFKATWGKMIYFILQFTVHHEGKLGQEFKQRRNLEARTDIEVMGSDACWLAPHSLLSLLFCTTQDSLSRVAPTPIGWALPHQSLIKKVPLEAWPEVSLWGEVGFLNWSCQGARQGGGDTRQNRDFSSKNWLALDLDSLNHFFYC